MIQLSDSKRYACIDIGTNSIRLLVTDVKDGKLINRKKKLQMTRLGYGVAKTNMLDPKKMIESLNVIDKFHHEAITAGAEDVFIYATSAVRDAYNGIDFRQMVYNKIEVEFDIISGTQEAKLGFYGARSGCDRDGDYLVMDIGGGSTEFIYGNKKGMKDAISIDIGGVRLTGTHVNSDPISDEDFKALSEHIDRKLRTVKLLYKDYEISQMVGIGGTACSFSSIMIGLPEYDPERIHGSDLTFDEVVRINNMLKAMTLADRRNVLGLQPNRADIIVAGGIILEHSMKIFGMDSIIVSDYDNLEGYLLKKLKKLDE